MRLNPLPLLLFAAGIVMITLPEASHISWQSFLTDVLVSLALVILSMLGLHWRIRAYPTKVLSGVYAMAMSLVISMLIFVLTVVLLKFFSLKSDGYWVYNFNNTDHLRFIMIWFCEGWMANVIVLRKQKNELKADFELQRSTTEMLREAELYKLRQQLQPHFLYNSLNSINALVLMYPEKAQAMVGQLSDFLRLSVKRETHEHISIGDELAYIESYLAIESIRFGDRLKVNIVKGADNSTNIPPFLLQPVLENAIKFGLYGNTGIVNIDISLEMQSNVLIIKVVNPFDPLTQPPRGTGFGLGGIRRRLYLLFARTDLLETSQDNNIYTTILKIPQHNV